MRFLSMAAGLLAAAAVSSLAAQTPDGTWKWSSELGDQTINSTLHLQSDGDKLTGTYKNDTLETAVEEGTYKDGKVKFEINVAMDNGNQLRVPFEGEVNEETIEGEGKFFVGGEQQGDTFPWTANRHVGNAEVVGTWQFDFTSPDGVTRRPKLVVTEKGGQLSGYMVSAEDSNDEEAITVDNLRVEDNTLSFEMIVQLNGDLNLKYICHPRGHQITGKLRFRNENGNEGEFDIAATREHLSPEAKKLVGKWVFVMTGDDGVERKPILTVQDDGGKLDVQLVDDGNEFELNNVELKDGQLSFDFVNDHDGVGVELEWTSKLVGDDEMEGTLAYNVNGNTGEIGIKGERHHQ